MCLFFNILKVHFYIHTYIVVTLDGFFFYINVINFNSYCSLEQKWQYNLCHYSSLRILQTFSVWNINILSIMEMLKWVQFKVPTPVSMRILLKYPKSSDILNKFPSSMKW